MTTYQDSQTDSHVDDSQFGFIVIGTNEALFGLLHGNTQEIVMRFSVDIPKKRHCGGTRAIRFARIRKERRQNYIEKVFDTAVQCFTTDGKTIVDGIILANVIEFNSDLRCPNIINPLIQERVLQQVIISYGGKAGFNQAIDLASETLVNTKLIQQKNILVQFFDEVSRESDYYCFGVEDTLKRMEAGAIETLIIWKDIDLYRLHNPKTKEIKIIYLRNDELEEFEKIRFVDWLAINYRTLGIQLEITTDFSQEGSQFVHGFTGIGGILRCDIERECKTINKHSEEIETEDQDYASFFDL